MTIFRIKAAWSGFSGAPGYSVFHFNAADEAAGPTPQACADAIHTFFTALAGNLPTAVRIQVEPAVERLDQATGEIVEFIDITAPAPVAGTWAGAFSSAVGACVTWSTGDVRNGRRVRGRTFLVPLSTNSYAVDGTLDAGALTKIRDAATALADDITGLCIFARPTAPGAADGFPASVTGSRVTDKTAVLRSRRD